MPVGRPREGNARRVTLSVKVTERERDELEAQFGSAYAGLRFAVEHLLMGLSAPVRGEPTASAGVRVGDVPDKMERDIAATIDGNTVDATRAEVGRIFNVEADVIAPPIVIVDSLDYPAGRGKKAHTHKPATLVDHEFEAGTKYETWACECGHVLPRRKATKS